MQLGGSLGLAAILVAAAVAAAAADYVVVRGGEASNFEVGQIIDGEAPVSLADGEALTLIGGHGRKIRIEGPYQGTLAKIDPQSYRTQLSNQTGGSDATRSLNVVAAVSNLLRKDGAGSGADAARRMSDPWMIDVSEPADHYIRDQRSALFWRAETGASDNLKLEAKSFDRSVGIPWPAGADRLEWPVEIAIEDGGNYRMETSRFDPLAFTVHLVPSSLPTRAHQAAWMAKRKCDRQALLLVLTAEIDFLIDDLARKGRY